MDDQAWKYCCDALLPWQFVSKVEWQGQRIHGDIVDNAIQRSSYHWRKSDSPEAQQQHEGGGGKPAEDNVLNELKYRSWIVDEESCKLWTIVADS